MEERLYIASEREIRVVRGEDEQGHSGQSRMEEQCPAHGLDECCFRERKVADERRQPRDGCGIAAQIGI